MVNNPLKYMTYLLININVDKLAPGIYNHIFRFLSHPAADAIRDRISEFQAFSSQHASSSDWHTFYSFFLDKKMHETIDILDDMYDRLGVRVGVDDTYFRPSLWRLYESQFPGCFSQGLLVNSRSVYRTSVSFFVI